MSNKKKYEDFPLSLALFDTLPVIFFCCGVLTIGMKYRNPVFLIGSVCCSLAGAGKVLWKIITVGFKNFKRKLKFIFPNSTFI